eukprot:TRINITY_DN18292_c0_g1_i1.p1 TRINITY_DN18292_c0_g1~~TRINITY_DN18292_c0_g1_i1.p1  ORF type:complete len:646 (+),score=100.00 TRINITY_DN18292_c0_g1_i1:23-1939(+)
MAASGPPKLKAQQSTKALRRTGKLHLDEEWTVPQRSLAYKVLHHAAFETFIGAVIFYNIIVIVAEADGKAACRTDKTAACSMLWVEVSNVALLVIYTLEALVRIYVYRGHLRHRSWDLFDITLVLFTYLDLVLTEIFPNNRMPGVQMLRIARLSKVVRGVRVVRMFPQLYSLARSFVSAMSAMFWGMVLIMFMISLVAILSVELIQPLSEDVYGDGKCSEVYDSVFSAFMLYVQTLLAGDSWGRCTMDIMDRHPHTIPFFVAALVFIQLGTTNLIMAVVLQKAKEASEQDVENRLRQVELERRNAERRLQEMCSSIDLDCDGTITLEELLEFYHTNEEMRNVFHILDIREEEIEALFNIMDKDQSGDLSYAEIVTHIVKADSNDLKRQVMMLKLQLQEVWERVRGEMQSTLRAMGQGIDALVKEILPKSRPRLSMEERIKAAKHHPESEAMDGYVDTQISLASAASSRASEQKEAPEQKAVEEKDREELRAVSGVQQPIGLSNSGVIPTSQQKLQELADMRTSASSLDDALTQARLTAFDERCHKSFQQLLDLRAEVQVAASKLAVQTDELVRILIEGRDVTASKLPNMELQQLAAPKRPGSSKLGNLGDANDGDLKQTSGADCIEAPPAVNQSWLCC